MNLSQHIKKLNNLDLDNIDITKIGEWPSILKNIIYFLIFIGTLGLGYQFYLTSLNTKYQRLINNEKTLKEDFLKKTGEAAQLVYHRKKMSSLETEFNALLKQLPGDTEVPGLLEDISLSGRGAGLQFESITLQPEKIMDFYIELPIRITVKGKYHDLGNFISSVSQLPRIVTLHNFKITASAEELKMDILAKTYRYSVKK